MKNLNNETKRAMKALELAMRLERADHVDVKLFMLDGHGKTLVSLMNLSEIIDLEQVDEEVAEVLINSVYSTVEKLKQDIHNKIEGSSRNTYFSAEENKAMAMDLNNKVLELTKRDLYKEACEENEQNLQWLR